jgi:hypothetical protein
MKLAVCFTAVSCCVVSCICSDGACVTFYTDGGQELECGQLPDKSYFSPGHSKDPYGRGAHLMTTAALSSDASHDVEAPDGANRTAVQSPSHSGDATATRTARHNHKQSRGRHGRKHHKDANSDAKSGKAPSRVLLEAEAMDNKRYNLPDGYGAYDGVYETKKRYYIPSTKPSGRHYYGQPGETSPVGPAGPGPTKCSVDSAPHQPEWTGVSDWWSIKANDDHPLGMAGGRCGLCTSTWLFLSHVQSGVSHMLSSLHTIHISIHRREHAVALHQGSLPTTVGSEHWIHWQAANESKPCS